MRTLGSVLLTAAVVLLSLASVYGRAVSGTAGQFPEQPRQPEAIYRLLPSESRAPAEEEPVKTQPEPRESPEDPYAYFRQMKADYLRFHRQNPDVFAMMDISQVSYEPIARREGSKDHYLTHSLEGEPDHKGVNFVSGQEEAGFGQNTLVYGHNLNGNERFGTLTQYQNARFFRSNAPVVVYDGLSDTFRIYEPFTFLHIVDGREFIRQKDFASEEERIAYNRSLQHRSVTDTSAVDPRSFETGESLFLQTCLEAQTLNRGVLGLNLIHSFGASELPSQPDAIGRLRDKKEGNPR